MLHIEAADEPSIVGRCVRPLCFAAEGDEYYGLPTIEVLRGAAPSPTTYQLGLQGSCTLIGYRSRFFFVFAKHQIARITNEAPESFDARMGLIHPLIDDGRDSFNIPYHSLLFGVGSDDVGDFVVAVAEGAMLTDYMISSFFPVTRTMTGQIGDEALAAGFPSHMQSLLMHQSGNRTIPFPILGKVIARENNGTGLVTSENKETLLDGMSGGPVFVVRLTSEGTVIAFIDGVIQRGGNGCIRYLTMERILNRIDSYLLHP